MDRTQATPFASAGTVRFPRTCRSRTPAVYNANSILPCGHTAPKPRPRRMQSCSRTWSNRGRRQLHSAAATVARWRQCTKCDADHERRHARSRWSEPRQDCAELSSGIVLPRRTATMASSNTFSSSSSSSISGCGLSTTRNSFVPSGNLVLVTILPLTTLARAVRMYANDTIGLVASEDDRCDGVSIFGDGPHDEPASRSLRRRCSQLPLHSPARRSSLDNPG